MDPPLVDVIIAAHQAAATLPRAVASVQAQSCPAWRIWLVDDASTDATPRVAAALARQEPRLTAVRLVTNRGAGAARNTAVRLGRAPWLAVLDADDTWEPDKLTRQLAGLGAAAWGCTGLWRQRPGAAAERVVPPANLSRALAQTDDAVVHSTVIYRRAAFEALGGFDERLRRSQDWDLFLRLLRRYGAPAVEPAPLTHYTLRAGGLPAHLVPHGRRCQAQILRRELLRHGPLGLADLLDGYVDRQHEWAAATGDRAAAATAAAWAVLLQPWRRWRWRRWWRASLAR
ncbi:MAG: glycosyltransferase family 2 protein [Fimbriimonadaceae bacterium]|nr:glycosyltransferase family 2 protein [Fimbriimonadaceae bacterium]